MSRFNLLCLSILVALKKTVPKTFRLINVPRINKKKANVKITFVYTIFIYIIYSKYMKII